MGSIRTGVKIHDVACDLAEMLCQSGNDSARATFLAAGGGPTAQPAYDSALKANTITYYRAVIASCVANGLQAGNFEETLRRLGTGGI